jgi:hypothetical protein
MTAKEWERANGLRVVSPFLLCAVFRTIQRRGISVVDNGFRRLVLPLVTALLLRRSFSKGRIVKPVNFASGGGVSPPLPQHLHKPCVKPPQKPVGAF